MIGQSVRLKVRTNHTSDKLRVKQIDITAQTGTQLTREVINGLLDITTNAAYLEASVQTLDR